MQRRLLLMLLAGAALVVGCQSSYPGAVGRPDTERLVVHLLDGEFVRFDGRRMAVDEFVYELRLRCRAVADATDQFPWIEVRTPRDDRGAGSAPRVLQAIRDAAYDSGVQHVELVYDDGSADDE